MSSQTNVFVNATNNIETSSDRRTYETLRSRTENSVMKKFRSVFLSVYSLVTGDCNCNSKLRMQCGSKQKQFKNKKRSKTMKLFCMSP